MRFSLAFRGYRMSEVDALLDRLARQLERPETPPEEATAEPDATGQGDVADTPAVREARGDEPST